MQTHQQTLPTPEALLDAWSRWHSFIGLDRIQTEEDYDLERQAGHQQGDRQKAGTAVPRACRRVSLGMTERAGGFARPASFCHPDTLERDFPQSIVPQTVHDCIIRVRYA